ncbi:MAG: tRNA preQ1(34) S-adenosylmethionine ribosyltransferase-isomerase QueA [Planctomycetota bacterium]|nr:tRNA preQ1(34) S-adenosylmethionine ribosyltransferase-isomerase QueA [Planctomycetota bacterium]
MTDELADYDYTLPEDRIARHPAERRDAARLMHVDRATGRISHHVVSDLPGLLRSNDRLVLNDTRVLPARLFGVRAATGGRWEGLYLETTANGEWRLLASTRGKVREGEMIDIHRAHDTLSHDRLRLQLISRDDAGVWTMRPVVECDVLATLARFGTLPLPPYMDRGLADRNDFERYQTVYAEHPGSVAAPTAGLHFTPELLKRCADMGIAHSFVTLHVGIGTFRPISVSRLDDHKMHTEWCEVSTQTAAALTATRAVGGRVVGVGTTSTRTLETAARIGFGQPWRGSTDIFIRPPYEFQAVDVQLTNFHLPRSSLLVMVSAFAGRELIRQAYEAAIRDGYRFYSYGDAMLIT